MYFRLADRATSDIGCQVDAKTAIALPGSGELPDASQLSHSVVGRIDGPHIRAVTSFYAER